MGYGDVAKPWPTIVEFYRELASRDKAFDAAAMLASRISRSGYVDAGLCGLTSMHDLILGPSRAVLDNPHLIVALDPRQGDFVLTYPSRDPHVKKWTRRATSADVFDVVERFVTKRARWYKKASPGRGSDPTTRR